MREQANELLNAPNPETLGGTRDRAILALLVGCGLRPAEILSLDVDQIQQREGRWVTRSWLERAIGAAPCQYRPGSRYDSRSGCSPRHL
jgi:integrase